MIRRLAPGVLLCGVVTLAATLLQAVELRLAGEAYLEALVLAILLGVGIRTLWEPGPFWHDGHRLQFKNTAGNRSGFTGCRS